MRTTTTRGNPRGWLAGWLPAWLAGWLAGSDLVGIPTKSHQITKEIKGFLQKTIELLRKLEGGDAQVREGLHEISKYINFSRRF